MRGVILSKINNKSHCMFTSYLMIFPTPFMFCLRFMLFPTFLEYKNVGEVCQK